MKMTSVGKVALLAVFSLGLLAPGALASNEPIPGIDVVVKKKPSGTAIHVTTDKNGAFVFKNLPAGTYILSVNIPQQKAIINTSRSNKKHSNISVAPGNGTHNVTIALEADEPAPETEITIAQNGGKIIGVAQGVVVAWVDGHAKQK